MRGWEPRAIDVKELLHFRLPGTPPSVVGAGDRRAVFLGRTCGNIMSMFTGMYVFDSAGWSCLACLGGWVLRDGLHFLSITTTSI